MAEGGAAAAAIASSSAAATGAAAAASRNVAAGSAPQDMNEVDAAARLRERYLSSWLALTGEQIEVQFFGNP